MRVVVTGAGGFLGGHVVKSLSDRGHQVVATLRRDAVPPAEWTDVEIFRVDLRSPEGLDRCLEGADALVHAAAATTGTEDEQFLSTVVATEKLATVLARSSINRVLHVSSLVVYDWGQAKGMLDESAALVKDPYGLGAYTIAKLWQERVLRRAASASRWSLTVLRPGFIWSEDRPVIAGMGRLAGGLHILFGPFSRLPLTHVRNCADAVVTALEREEAAGETINVIDSDSVRVWEYARLYARLAGKRRAFIPVPYWMGYGIAQVAKRTSLILFGPKGKLPSILTPARYQTQFKSLRFSNEKLSTLLGWKPPVSFETIASAAARLSRSSEVGNLPRSGNA